MDKELLMKKVSLSDLVKGHKYRNINNIIRSSQYYFYRGVENLNLEKDIVDNSTATMAFRLIQHYLNQIFIEKSCWTYVFKDINYNEPFKIKDGTSKITETQQ